MTKLAKRNALVEANYELVRAIASGMLRRVPPSIELDDMVHEGVFGLIDAAERFDPSRGVPFRLYAKLRIRGAIMDATRRRHYSNATHAPLDEAPEPPVLPDIEDRIDRSRSAKKVGQVLEMLPVEQRKVVSSYYAKGKTNADIGREAGVEPRKVCEIHRQALGTMRRDLEARGVRKAA